MREENGQKRAEYEQIKAEKNLKRLAYDLREDTVDSDLRRKSRAYRRRHECDGNSCGTVFQTDE